MAKTTHHNRRKALLPIRTVSVNVFALVNLQNLRPSVRIPEALDRNSRVAVSLKYYPISFCSKEDSNRITANEFKTSDVLRTLPLTLSSVRHNRLPNIASCSRVCVYGDIRMCVSTRGTQLHVVWPALAELSIVRF